MVGRPPAGADRVAAPGGLPGPLRTRYSQCLGSGLRTPPVKMAAYHFFYEISWCLIFRRIGVPSRVMASLSSRTFPDRPILFQDPLEHENHDDRVAGHRAGGMAGHRAGTRCRAADPEGGFARRGPGLARREHGADPGQPGPGHPARHARGLGLRAHRGRHEPAGVLRRSDGPAAAAAGPGASEAEGLGTEDAGCRRAGRPAANRPGRAARWPGTGSVSVRDGQRPAGREEHGRVRHAGWRAAHPPAQPGGQR